jgi:hypothetical protein
MPARALTAAPSGVGTRPNLGVAEHSAHALHLGTTAPLEEQIEVSEEAAAITKPPHRVEAEAAAARDANPPGLVKTDAIK